MLVVVNGIGIASRMTADPVAAADVPFWVVTATLAIPANPAGTTATRLVGELTTKAASLPPTVTWVAPEKLLPTTVKKLPALLEFWESVALDTTGFAVGSLTVN